MVMEQLSAPRNMITKGVYYNWERIGRNERTVFVPAHSMSQHHNLRNTIISNKNFKNEGYRVFASAPDAPCRIVFCTQPFI